MKASSAEAAATLGVRIATGFLDRARGLLLQPDPAPGRGLLLTGVRTVHGFGLRRPLDLVYLDAEGRVLDCAVLRPWRIAGSSAACHVIELRRGECERLRLMPGRVLAVSIVSDICGGQPSAGRWRRTAPWRIRYAAAAAVIVIVLAAMSSFAWAARSADPAGTRSANTQSAVPTVDRFVGEPRRKRVTKARGSVHHDAADGVAAKPLRKARTRRTKGRSGPEEAAAVEYFVGEPGRHAAQPDRQAAQGDRKHEPAPRP